MATKNRLAHTLWITKAIRILPAKLSKQKRLDCACQERVGISLVSLQTLHLCGFARIFLFVGYKLATFCESAKAHLAVKLPQGKRFIRCDSLGENYTVYELLNRLGCEQIAKPTAKKKALSPAGKKPSLLIDIEAKLQQGKGAGYEKWAKTFNLKESAKTLIYLQEHGLDDYADVGVSHQLTRNVDRHARAL